MAAGDMEKRPVGRPQQVTVEQLRHVALRVADRDGTANLSMRGVARECGVSPMALYRHVDSIERLQDLVVDEALRGLFAEPVEGSWRDRIMMMMSRTRRRLLDHPGAAAILNARATPVAEIIRVADWYFGVLGEAGFTGAGVVQAFDALSVFLQGSVAFELTRQSAARLALLDSGLPREHTEHLRRYRAELQHRDGDAHFRLGAEALLDGLERKLLRT